MSLKRKIPFEGPIFSDVRQNQTTPRVRRKNDHPMGPGFQEAEGPSQRLPRIQAFLQDQDRDRHSPFFMRLAEVKKYLKYASRLRDERDPDFTPELEAILLDCKKMVEVHENFEEWVNGRTRWSNDIGPRPPKLIQSRRLPVYDRLQPQPPVKGVEDWQPLVYTSLLPRPAEISHPPFISFPFDEEIPAWDDHFGTPEGDFLLRALTALYDHENKLWSKAPGFYKENIFESSKKSNAQGAAAPNIGLLTPKENHDGTETRKRGISVTNYSLMEQKEYERMSSRSLDDLTAGPSRKGLSNTQGSFGDVFVYRGWRRAAIQRCLNVLATASENSTINTPWRRVSMPLAAKKTSEVHFHPLVLQRRPHQLRGSADPNSLNPLDRCQHGEPSPWVFWYNEYLQQTNYLYGWARQTIHKKGWNNDHQIALPMNFNGPYTFINKCCNEDYWFKMRHSLKTLKENLISVRTTHSRQLMNHIVEDIERGERGLPVADGVIPRVGIDNVWEIPSKFHLVDEVDVSWLEFLCQPTPNDKLFGSSATKKEDTLLILFDHRMQTLFNDTLNSPFLGWLEQGKGEEPVLAKMSIGLQELVAMINRGGRQLQGAGDSYSWIEAPLPTTTREPANKLYQFSETEAMDCCMKLAALGRLTYSIPVSPDHGGPGGESTWTQHGCQYYQCADWKTTPHSVGLVEPKTHPEHRIQWRHASKQSLDRYNAECKREFVRKKQKLPKQQFSTENATELSEFRFMDEISWVQGTYDTESVEFRRDAPKWDDLLDRRLLAQEDAHVSTRTTTFLRMIAYRIGTTIRQVNERFSPRVNQSLTRKTLANAMKAWEKLADKGPGSSNGKSGPKSLTTAKLNAVIARCHPDHESLTDPEDGLERRQQFTIIRHGLIDDAVKNHTMLYPSRLSASTDTKGFLVEYIGRPSIWGWARELVRRHHAVYRRERYFDMRRWPLNRQKTEIQSIIKSRRDENPEVQPPASWLKYRVSVGTKAESPLVDKSIFSSITESTDEPHQQEILRQLATAFVQLVTPSVKHQEKHVRNADWTVEITPPTFKTNSTVVVANVKEKKLHQAQDGIRPRSVFIPGRVKFPLGDTRLKKIYISHLIEKTLHPKPEPSLRSQVMSGFGGLFRASPKLVPLLPEIDSRMIPQSDLRKRKIPSSFMRSTDEPPRKIPAVMSLQSGRATRRGRVSAGTKRHQIAATGDTAATQVTKAISTENSGIRVNTGEAATGMNTTQTSHPPPLSRITELDFDDGLPTGSPPRRPILSANPIRDPMSTPIPSNSHGQGVDKTLPKPEIIPLDPHPRNDISSSSASRIPPVRAMVRLRPHPGLILSSGIPHDADNLAVGVTFDEAIGQEAGLLPHLSSSDHNISASSKDKAGSTEALSRQDLTLAGTPSRDRVWTSVSAASSISPSSRLSKRPIVRRAVVELGSAAPFKSIPDRPAPKRSAQQDTNGERPLKRTKPATAETDEAPPPRKDAKAQALLDSCFPEGHEPLDTPGTDLECGLWALRLSVEAQFPKWTAPEIEELREISRDPQKLFGSTFQEAMLADVALDNSNNFTIDQIGCILQAWGRGRGLRLNVGVLMSDKSCFVVSTPDEVLDGLVWIHNDEGEAKRTADKALEKKKRKIQVGRYNHYSGLAPLAPKTET